MFIKGVNRKVKRNACDLTFRESRSELLRGALKMLVLFPKIVRKIRLSSVKQQTSVKTKKFSPGSSSPLEIW